MSSRPCMRPDTYERKSVSQETGRNGSRISRSISIDADTSRETPNSHSIINKPSKLLIYQGLATASALFTVTHAHNASHKLQRLPTMALRSFIKRNR